jgi:DNA-binding MarR family transcriptional regulator
MKNHLSVFPIEKSMGFVIHSLDTELALGLKRKFKDSGFNVTPEQWSVLSKLWEIDGLHQSELAKRSRKNRHNMTRIINLLKKNGYIYRTPDEKDKRLLLVHLTEKGRSIQGHLTEIVLEYLAFAFKGLTIKQIKEMHKTHLSILSNLGHEMS